MRVSSVAYLGLVARHLMRGEKTGDKCCRFLHSQRKANFILVISSAACEREFDDCFDKFAIKVVNNGETVGHLPRKFSKIAWYRLTLFWCFGDDSWKITDFFSRCSRR